MLKFYKGPWPKKPKMMEESLVNVDQDLGYKKSKEKNNDIEVVVAKNLNEEQIIISKKKDDDDIKSKNVIQEDMFIDEIVIDPLNQITETRSHPNEEIDQDQNVEKITTFDNSISSETKNLDAETKSGSKENFEQNPVIVEKEATSTVGIIIPSTIDNNQISENFAYFKEELMKVNEIQSEKKTTKVENSNVELMKIPENALISYSEQALTIFQASLPPKIKNPKVENLIKPQNIQCEFCDLNFPSIKSLKIHLEEIHKKNQDEIHEISQNSEITASSRPLVPKIEKPKAGAAEKVKPTIQKYIFKAKKIHCEFCNMNLMEMKSFTDHLYKIHKKATEEIIEITKKYEISVEETEIIHKTNPEKLNDVQEDQDPPQKNEISKIKKNYPCEFCTTISFSYKKSFLKHLEEFHQKTIAEIKEIIKKYEMAEEKEIGNNTNSNTELTKYYSCDFCTMSFSYLKSFFETFRNS